MVSMMSTNFMQCESASACSAAASFSCANLFHIMDAAMLASILFALLVLGLHILGVLVVVIAISILRIIVCDRKMPESRA